MHFDTAGSLWPGTSTLDKSNVGRQYAAASLISARLQQYAKLQVGCVILTSHRLLWIDISAAPDQGNSCQLPLSAVSEVQLKASMVLRSPKIRVLTFVDEHGKPASGDATVQLLGCNNTHLVRLLLLSCSSCYCLSYSLSCCTQTSSCLCTSARLSVVLHPWQANRLCCVASCCTHDSLCV